MQRLSRRVTELNESQTIKMAQLSREMKSKGIDIVDLSLGEPDFTTPAHIKKAAKDAIEQDYSFYPPVAGFLDVREAIAQKLKRDNNLNYKPSQIVVSTGAKQSLANVILSVVGPGDEVIVPTPYWVTYGAQIELAEGTMVNIHTTIENDFKITPQQLKDAINEKTKAFLFSSPCNPTGSVYSKEELRALADVFKDYPNIIIISDEIYEYINFLSAHESIAQFDFLKDQVVIINGLSKGFAMTGWRIGYMAAPDDIAAACNKIQGQFTSGTNTIAQRSIIAALSGDLSPTDEMRQAFRKRRDMMIELLSCIDGLKLNKPDGAFYLFPDISGFFDKKYTTSDGSEATIKDADDLSMYIMEYGRVSTVTGKAFGDDNCIRLSYANSEENLRKAALRIKEVLQKLR